jgi:hypothetical protein
MSANRVIDTPRVCPQCQGEGVVNEVSFQRGFAECFMCAGQGVISERVCNCGRPLVWYYGQFASCNSNECYLKAKNSEIERLKKVVAGTADNKLLKPGAY